MAEVLDRHSNQSMSKNNMFMQQALTFNSKPSNQYAILANLQYTLAKLGKMFDM